MWRHYLAQMVKLADTLVSGTSAARLGGSSPPLGKGNGEYPAGYSFFLDRGLEPEPAPSGGEEEAPGWRRQQAEAGWRAGAGSPSLEAKSPSGQR